MKSRILFLILILQMTITLLSLNGCSSRSGRAIGKEEAVVVAKKEVVRRGWKEVKVGSARLDGGLWIIRLERLPKVYGGFAVVEVSTNGNVVRYLPGL